MDQPLPFQRARKPEERELRREAILAAAAELFDAEGQQGAGLNAIAAKAGFTKSNVYRYFESREEVLLSLLLRELEAFVPKIETRLADLTPGDIDGIARVSAETFVAHPRLSLLISIVASVLEQNVSEAAILEHKRGISGIYARIGRAIHSRMPGTTLEDCAWVGAMTGTLVAGLWPTVFSAPAAARVMAMPEFQHLRPDANRDIRRAMKALLASITASA